MDVFYLDSHAICKAATESGQSTPGQGPCSFGLFKPELNKPLFLVRTQPLALYMCVCVCTLLKASEDFKHKCTEMQMSPLPQCSLSQEAKRSTDTCLSQTQAIYQ